MDLNEYQVRTGVGQGRERSASATAREGGIASRPWPYIPIDPDLPGILLRLKGVVMVGIEAKSHPACEA